MPDGNHGENFPGMRAWPVEPSTEDIVVPATQAQSRYLAGLRQAGRKYRAGLAAGPAAGMLGILDRERLAALDLRLAGQPMDGPGKISEAAARITSAAGHRPRGLQVVFCELGLYYSVRAPLPPGVPSSWDIRSELAGELETHGMPGDSVYSARIYDLQKPGATEDLTAKCREGTIKVVLASTSSISFIRPVLDRVAAVHHLDVPFSTDDARHRVTACTGKDGAVPPQFRYFTSGSTDAAGWQAIGEGRSPIETAQSILAGNLSASSWPGTGKPPARRPSPSPGRDVLDSPGRRCPRRT